MPIKMLPNTISSKIAAGEVIERPSSVVKELLENSLDAGSNDITVDLTAGGIDQIRVADNGSGIPVQEVELAFKRFATSKLSESHDLESISTLGFRGEALPSIASISDVTLVTRTKSDPSGSIIRISDGKTLNRGSVGASEGTAVSVNRLFYSIPARRKFLKSASAESSRIKMLIARYSLAYPQVRFTLSVDGSESFSTLGSGDLRDVVAELYGAQAAHSMLELNQSRDIDNDLPIVSGMISPPTITRSNRNQITIFVNGRWVQNRALTYALHDSYRGFLMERRFPIAILCIKTPFDQIDVNVHPSKTEVRFLKESPVFSAVQKSVRNTLNVHTPLPLLGHRSSNSHPITVGLMNLNSTGNTESVSSMATSENIPTDDINYPNKNVPVQPILLRNSLPALRILGQIQSTYIVAESPEGVYFIDQHAAHERVLFEEILQKDKNVSSSSQVLMEPVTVKLDQRQLEIIEEDDNVLFRLGFHYEPFGLNTYLLRTVPNLITRTDPQQALLDVLDTIAEGRGFESWEERAAYSLACHGAIRANMPLTEKEMSTLILRLEKCNQPQTCPHGRPTMIHLGVTQLEQDFGRR